MPCPDSCKCVAYSQHSSKEKREAPPLMHTRSLCVWLVVWLIDFVSGLVPSFTCVPKFWLFLTKFWLKLPKFWSDLTKTWSGFLFLLSLGSHPARSLISRFVAVTERTSIHFSSINIRSYRLAWS